jgi:signal transduction histidine kinase/CheY-like chemotaxis protein
LIDVLFSTVVPAVAGAGLGAWILAIVLVRFEVLDWRLAIGWAVCMTAAALGHMLLFSLHRRPSAETPSWKVWARWFTLLAFVEGVGWGAMPVMVALGSNFDIEMFAMVVTLGVAAASISPFSPHLPAFAAFFFPATLFYAVWSALTPSPLHEAGSVLMGLFVITIFGLGVAANRSLRQTIELRLETAELAEDLRRQKEIAEAASLSKSSFLAAASHDLRQPVHALGLFVGALRGIEMSSEGRHLVEQIEASTNAMDGLFTSLLDISKLDAGIVEVHETSFAIGPLIQRVCRDSTAEAMAKGLRLQAITSTVSVRSDPLLVERVLRNLVSNAVRYTDAGGIVVGCRRRGGAALVQVWDTGPGIPKDRQQLVFEEYYQLDNPERDRAKGLGLGLAIVRRLSELLGSPVLLRSEVGRGSCFEMALPLSHTADIDAELPFGETAIAPAHVLIVVIDDEQAIREGMSTLLAGWGHDVLAAGSGDEAIARLATHPVAPGLIICDYRLRDGETGLSVIEQLRAEYNDTIPAMLITGDTAPDRLAEAQASGLLLLHKPVSNGRLRAAIINLTSRSRLASEEETAAGSGEGS